MSIASTPALQADLRFRGAPMPVRGAYRMLLDFEDAAGNVVARGLDGVAAAAAALGCSRDEATELIRGMEAHGLAALEPDRLCLIVGSRRGKRGGMSPAERVRAHRAKARETTHDVTAGNGFVTGGGNGSVTGQVPAKTDVPANGNGRRNGSDGGVCNGHLSPSLPPSRSLPLSPLCTPLSLPLLLSLPPTPRPCRGRRRQAADRGEARGEVPAKPKPAPLPFTLAAALAELAAAAPERFVPGEGRDVSQGTAVAITAAIRSYPTLAEWRVLGEWLAAGAMAHRPSLGPSWVASAGLREAMALSRAWDRAGRPDPRATPGAPSRTQGAPGRPGSAPARPTRLRPAPCSRPEDFADDNDPSKDPLLGLL